MKKIINLLKHQHKRITAFVALCVFVFSIGCSKKRDLSLPTSEQEKLKISQIAAAYKSLYNDPEFLKAIEHPEFGKTKAYAEGIQFALYDYMSATINLYEVNEKLKNGLITTQAELETQMKAALDLKESTTTKINDDFREYSRIMKDSGIAKVVDNHYNEIMENSGSENHPMVKGSIDYFSNGYGVEKTEVINRHNNPQVQEDLKKGYTASLNDMESVMALNKQQEIDKKALMLGKAADYFAAKQITDLEIIPEADVTRWCGPSCILKKIRDWLIYLFRLMMTTMAKVFLKTIDILTVVHYNEYFCPNISIIKIGYTPNYGFYVGGGRSKTEDDLGAIPVEYPIIISNKWVKGFLVYAENLFYLELDGEKTLITDQNSIPGWIKSSVKSRGNRVMIEATIDMTVNSDKIYNLSGVGYSLVIKLVNKVYRDANGPKVVLYDPIGDEVAYNTVRAIVKFNEDIDPATINSTNFFIKDENGNDFPCSIVYAQDPYAFDENAVFLNFQIPIVKGKSYTVTMTDGVLGISGKYVQSSVSWTFRVGAFSNLFDTADAQFDNSRFGY